jgi:hypothetical protein
MNGTKNRFKNIVCARDRDPYEVKNESRQSEEREPAKLRMRAGKNKHMPVNGLCLKSLVNLSQLK